MRKFVTGVAMVASSLALGACKQEPATDNVAAEANTEVLVDENAAMAANAAMDANATVDGNAADANVATDNVTEQGSTDH
ncbi:MAG TPA: hypothetical protein VJ763_02235 [Sphingomicrobium sp.]|jgi:hypothetical protein|nr:hypothetical protein [Sphingomicrobium sp.]